MKLTNKKFSILVYALIILLVILGCTTWLLLKDSSSSRDIVQNNRTASMALLEEKTMHKLEFAPTLALRLQPLLDLLSSRFSLLTENVKMKASAPELTALSSQKNKYLSFQLLEPNAFQDMLSVRSTLSSSTFMKDFGERSCPITTDPTASGTTLPTLDRSLVMHYFIQDGSRNPHEFTVQGLPFHTSNELAKDIVFEASLPIYMLDSGKHTITGIPGCTTKSGISSLMSEGLLSSEFEKKDEPLSIYESESNTNPVLKILAPTISSIKAGNAERSIPYVLSKGGKILRQDAKIPYIQTSSALSIKAESTLPEVGSGGLLTSYHTRFDLFLGDKLQSSALSQESQPGQKATWVGNFTGLKKGEYTLVTRLIKQDDKGSEVVRRSKVDHIGIGDIIMAIGDDTVTGYAGAVSLRELSMDNDSGRQIAFPSKECEYAISLKQACKKETGLYYGFSNELGNTLSTKFGYPVLVLPEGAAQGADIKDLMHILNDQNSSLVKRLTLLSPSKLLLMLSPGALPEDLHTKEEITTLLGSLRLALDKAKNGQNIPTYLSIPQFEEQQDKSELFALTTKEFSLSDGTFLPGPNFYKLFFEELLSSSSRNLYKQDAEEHRFVNDLGLKKIATKWAEFIE